MAWFQVRNLFMILPSIWGGDSAFLPLPIKFGIEISAVCWSDLGVGRISGDPSDSSFPGMEVRSGFCWNRLHWFAWGEFEISILLLLLCLLSKCLNCKCKLLGARFTRMVVSLQRHPVFSMLPQGSARLESRPTYRWMRVLQLKRSRKYSQYTVAIQVCSHAALLTSLLN